MNHIVPTLIAVLLVMIGTALGLIVIRAPDPAAQSGSMFSYTEENLNAVAWVQTAGEYDAACDTRDDAGDLVLGPASHFEDDPSCPAQGFRKVLGLIHRGDSALVDNHHPVTDLTHFSEDVR